MPYTGLSGFISDLEKKGELLRITTFVDPVLEITEITDRMVKSGGKALLFENTGTTFPLLINAFGSENRMSMALGRTSLDEAVRDISSTFAQFTETGGSLMKKLSSLPSLARLAGYMPARIRGRGACQQVIHKDPDLSILPVLKCWPHDGGRFITLPMVHTVYPLTGKTNVGMYRMQVLDNKTTGMHWQRHKTGANHFAEWKKKGGRMPVAVALGGDPVYTYASTAPMPENFDEYMLAGFLRRKRVRLVKCITADLYVPFDADIVIEGFVDTSEELFSEGPFGDHTGFYSLADLYPKFHVTCITHRRNAVYPATIVGVPPMEDQWFAAATEKIFLAPLKLTILPEVEDIHMPSAGVAHNLVIVRIRKTYPGQGKKVISSLLGAGQMMFTKFMVVVSGEVDIRNYEQVAENIALNADFLSDLLFMSGPLDVLDHASDIPALGGKLGIDATVKQDDELPSAGHRITGCRIRFEVINIDQADQGKALRNTREQYACKKGPEDKCVVLAVGKAVDTANPYQVAWQVLGNTDPQRDIEIITGKIIFVDGTPKAFREGGFPRKWPNVVCSLPETILSADKKWESLAIGPFIMSPSITNAGLLYPGNDYIITDP